jgi:hypothetical protein
MSLGRKTKSVCHAALPSGRCRPVVGRNSYRRYLSRLRGYRFEISATLRKLGWIDAPQLRILKSLEQTQEIKKIKITFEICVKMLDG